MTMITVDLLQNGALSTDSMCVVVLYVTQYEQHDQSFSVFIHPIIPRQVPHMSTNTLCMWTGVSVAQPKIVRYSNAEVRRDRILIRSLHPFIFSLRPPPVFLQIPSKAHLPTAIFTSPNLACFPPLSMVSTAFVPAVGLTVPRTAPAVSRRVAPVMSLRKQTARLAALPATLATIAPVLATEGTGESLGIDNPLLFLPLFVVPAVFLALYLQFDGGQDKDDFFGAYDDRRR